MGGRLRASFRSGNLAEDFGALLLKGIAAVAEVSRPEDFGLDAVATLLRLDSDGNHYPEDTFVVQFKSAGTAVIEYDESATKWFVGQSQPMFIGRVSLADGTIALHPTIYANQGAFAMHATTIKMTFGHSAIPSFSNRNETARWVGLDDDAVQAWLGEPLLTWNLKGLADRGKMEATYRTLKRYLALARLEHDLLQFGQCSNLKWGTNDPATIQSTGMLMMKSGPDDLEIITSRCIPAFQSLLMHAVSRPEPGATAVVEHLVGLASALREIGVEVDPANWFSIQLLLAPSRQAPTD